MSTTGRPAGFTLVETMVMLLLMGVLVTLVAVRMGSATQGVALRESARQLLTTARYARNYAAVCGCDCRLTLDLQQQQYTLTCRADPEKDEFEPMLGGRIHRLQPPVKFAGVFIDSDNKDTDQENTITFSPTGRATGGAITFTDGQGVYSLLIAGHTGLARMVPIAASDIPQDRQDLDE